MEALKAAVWPPCQVDGESFYFSPTLGGRGGVIWRSVEQYMSCELNKQKVYEVLMNQFINNITFVDHILYY